MAIGYVITSISVSEAVEVSKYLCLWHINSTKDLQIFRWNCFCSWHLALNLNSPYLLAKVSCNVLLNQKTFLEKATLDMRPVPTKWETSRKSSFESYKQILDVQTLSFKMIYTRIAALFRVQNPLFPWEIPLFSIDFWNVQWAISPLIQWRLVAHYVRMGLIMFNLKNSSSL